jgi:hypothetical protein
MGISPRLGALLALAVTASASAVPTTWLVADGGNGHGYEVIPVGPGVDDFTWAQAESAATALGGHLATITSQAENDFIADLLAAAQHPPDGLILEAWLGGFQAQPGGAPDGDWAWNTGEPMTYTNWSAGEPNDLFGTAPESHLGIWADPHFLGAPFARWNDEGQLFNIDAYVVEYVPEPSMLILLIGGTPWLVYVNRRRG